MPMGIGDKKSIFSPVTFSPPAVTLLLPASDLPVIRLMTSFFVKPMRFAW
jgi:hypothetical protein